MNEFSRVEDTLYSLNSYTHLKFHTKITECVEGRTKSNHNEYKTSNKKAASVVIKRKLSFYLTLECTDKDKNKNSVLILPEQMYEVIDKFNYIRTKWFNRDNNRSIFGLIHNELVIIDQREMVIISCVADKFLRIFPAVYKTDNGEQILALTLYIGDSNPITIFPEKFIAMTYLLSTLDMLNYANMALSTSSLRVEPINRVSFVEDKSDSFEPPTTSKIGREFKFKQDANNII